jgi:hypothetical protein
MKNLPLSLSAKKFFSFATSKRKKKPQCPNRLITVDAVLSSCLPFEANAHQSSHVSTTIINSSMAGRMYIVLYHQQV